MSQQHKLASSSLILQGTDTWLFYSVIGVINKLWPSVAYLGLVTEVWLVVKEEYFDDVENTTRR